MTDSAHPDKDEQEAKSPRSVLALDVDGVEYRMFCSFTERKMDWCIDLEDLSVGRLERRENHRTPELSPPNSSKPALFRKRPWTQSGVRSFNLLWKMSKEINSTLIFGKTSLAVLCKHEIFQGSRRWGTISLGCCFIFESNLRRVQRPWKIFQGSHSKCSCQLWRLHWWLSRMHQFETCGNSTRRSRAVVHSATAFGEKQSQWTGETKGVALYQRRRTRWGWGWDLGCQGTHWAASSVCTLWDPSNRTAGPFLGWSLPGESYDYSSSTCNSRRLDWCSPGYVVNGKKTISS